jgi:predicted nucleic acid-binding protein
VAESPALAYFDTSALAKRYVAEDGSLRVRRLLRRHVVVSSAVAQVEICSALRRRRAEGILSEPVVQRVLRRVQSDVASWRSVAVIEVVVALACELVRKHKLRTLDAIHLASAETLRREGLPVPFVTADVRQAAAARAVGLSVIDARTDRAISRGP